jgi:hypothetical protein
MYSSQLNVPFQIGPSSGLKALWDSASPQGEEGGLHGPPRLLDEMREVLFGGKCFNQSALRQDSLRRLFPSIDWSQPRGIDSMDVLVQAALVN